MKKLIRKILREHKSDKYYRFLDKISSIIEKPYFKNMYEKNNGGFWDITNRDDQEYILKNIFGSDISIDIDVEYISDDKDNIIYVEYDDGSWRKSEYNDNGNKIYQEHSDGWWGRFEYDDNGNNIYFESSYGTWKKWVYDDKGNQIYYEDSYGDINDNR
jgi:hypothetical protein